ncbi:MAG: phosphoglycerate kinase [Holosporales bacterium]|jgi:phosphoglycerate kinase|nr:phosphoglycerate kinase [Holosporales bacterium]
MIKNFEAFKEFCLVHKNVKKCVLRADLNLPSGIEDLSRIYAIRDTVLDVLGMGLNVILISHYKRPSIEDVSNQKYSLRNIVDKVSRVLNEDVHFIGDSIFDIAPDSVNSKITLLENLRFYDGETKNDSKLAERLSKFGDVYINDAFSVSHRKHASVCAITEYLPSFAGYSLMREIKGISKVTSNIARPFTAIIGGSKISSKIEVLQQISKTADNLIIAGAMANTFLAATGVDMQKSLVEPDQFEMAKKILGESAADIVLPMDFLVAGDISEMGKNHGIHEIPEGFACFDIGGESVRAMSGIIGKSKTLLWNGALGAFEFSNFNKSSEVIAKFVADKTSNDGMISIIGGGETVASLGNYRDDMTFISTAGGAFLEFVAGYELPGVASLSSD